MAPVDVYFFILTEIRVNIYRIYIPDIYVEPNSGCIVKPDLNVNPISFQSPSNELQPDRRKELGR